MKKQMSLLISGVLLAVTTVNANSKGSLQAELANVRALPFGHVAICEQGDLKIRGKSTATFVIRDSYLCNAALEITQQQHGGVYVVCSSDPGHSRTAIKTTLCADLKVKPSI